LNGAPPNNKSRLGSFNQRKNGKLKKLRNNWAQGIRNFQIPPKLMAKLEGLGAERNWEIIPIEWKGLTNLKKFLRKEEERRSQNGKPLKA